MSKLLSANFTRLKKNRLFWGEILTMFVFALILIGIQYKNIQDGFESSLDSVLFGYTLLIGIIISVFSSIFLGTEYSDGTIRNKILIGYSRIDIYFGNLITNIAVSLFMCLSFLLAVIAVGIPLIGFPITDIVTILKIFLGTFILNIAFCSIFTMIDMLYSNKAGTAVVSILFIFILFFLSIYITEKLEAPQYYEYVSIDKNMELQTVLNPNYLMGTQRTFYEFLFDFLPTGQSIQYMTITVKHLWRLPLYSLIIIIITTIIGVIVFKQKDIK